MDTLENCCKPIKERRLNKNIQRILILCFGVLIILGGLQVLFGGVLNSTSVSNSIYEFNGFERLIGLPAIAVGALFIYLVFTKQTRLD